jgi:hypothetical protein
MYVWILNFNAKYIMPKCKSLYFTYKFTKFTAPDIILPTDKVPRRVLNQYVKYFTTHSYLNMFEQKRLNMCKKTYTCNIMCKTSLKTSKSYDLWRQIDKFIHIYFLYRIYLSIIAWIYALILSLYIQNRDAI